MKHHFTFLLAGEMLAVFIIILNTYCRGWSLPLPVQAALVETSAGLAAGQINLASRILIYLLFNFSEFFFNFADTKTYFKYKMLESTGPHTTMFFYFILYPCCISMPRHRLIDTGI
jgi:hypothetical protein